MPIEGRLKGKVAVITGAASGIGLETALLFAQEGASVVMADINPTAGQKALALVQKHTKQALFQQTDVSNEQSVQQLMQKAEQEFGRLDIVFNNAGIMDPQDDNAETTSEQVWDRTMNINVKGVWYGCKHALPALRRSGGGSVINTASFVALMGAATPQLAYTASKGAVLAMTRELAAVHAKENIRFNSLCPGPIRTPLLMDFLNTDEKRNRRLVHVPMGRFGEAIEQAKAALFLASDDSSYVTGTEFAVDGGLTSAYVTPLGETKTLCPHKSLIPQ